MSVKEHYENHLGNFYSWMLGDFDARQKEQEEYFIRNCIFPRSNKIALDLGAGNGIQSVTLAKLGFEVKSIDFNTQLTDELRSRSKNLDIEVINDEFTNYSVLSRYSPELVVCMGDTVTHLESVDQLNELINNIYILSEPDAIFIISYRDLSKELKDEQRFIPVKADNTKILTCFLEYFTDYVRVTDILYENTGKSWNQKVSSYNKLRLNLEVMRNIFARNNFNLVHMEIVGGMNYLIFKKK